MQMWARRAALLLSLLAGHGSASAMGEVVLSAEEQRWIEAHPLLRVGVAEDSLPFEYMKGSQLHGRSLYYLELMSHLTGIRFSYIPSKTQGERERMLQEGQVDLLSSYFRFKSAPLDQTVKVQPYHTTSPIIVMRVGSPAAFDLDQLQGKIVVIPDTDYYEAMFRHKGINSTLIRSNSAMQMLTLLEEGKADAVVASNTGLMPFLFRRFTGVLQITGVVGSEPLDINMAVQSEQTILLSILEKALKSITPQERNDIYQHFFRDLDVESLSLSDIRSHYLHLLLLGLLTLLTLGVLVCRSLVHRLRAMRSEHEKTLFLALMDHAIRTPMNAALAAIDLLGHTRLNQQQRHFSDLANNGVATLLRLLDNVFDTSKPQASNLRVVLVDTDVEMLLQGVADLHRLRASEKQLTLNLYIEAQLPLLLLDSILLGQVIHNLLSNSIKFTDAGRIDIDVRLAVEKSAAPQLLIEVRDTGIGISKTVQASLFRAYAQASNSYRRSGGTGLGLVICQQMVDVMSGSLTLTSEPGVGTTVTVRLPARHAGESVSTSTEVRMLPPAAVFGGLQVLVVEDTLANQQVLRAQISSLGCLPVIAATAGQAHALFAQNCYDLILMDCDLPDQDGYSLAHQLRALELQVGRPHCPIIAISALTGDQHNARCMAAGMDGMSSKPIGLDRLREVIERWCEVTLTGPSTELMEYPSNEIEIYREIARDLGNLVRALALHDRETALCSAHRLHGATLVLAWEALAESSNALENLLRADVSLDNPSYVKVMKALLARWKVVSNGMLLEVLQTGELNG